MRAPAAAAVLLLLVGAARAEKEPRAGDSPAMAAPAAPARPKLPDTARLDAQARKAEDAMIQRLAKVDRDAAARLRARRETLRKIDAVLAQLRAGKLDEAEARARLAPLVEEQAEEDGRRIDARVQQLQAKLDYLERARENRELLVRRRVDLLLGKTPDDARAFDDAPAPPNLPEAPPMVKPPAR